MKHDIVAILSASHGLNHDAALPPGTAADHFGDWAVVRATNPAAAPFGAGLRRRRIKEAPRRQKQLEDLMALGTVVPVLPGQPIARRDHAALIAANAPLLRQAASRVAETVQYQIVVHWTPEDVLGRFRDAPEIAPLFTATAVLPNTLTQAVQRLAGRLAAEIAGLLSPVAQEVAELPTEDAMVINLVLLVDRARIDALERAVEAVDAIWPEGLRIQQIGPGPATSFSALRFTRYGPNALLQAQRLLGLDESCSAQDVEVARKEALRLGAAPAAELRQAAALLTARAALPAGTRHLYLADIHAETARPALATAEVA